MLRQVAEDVLIHQSELLQNNAIVVQGRAGVLLTEILATLQLSPEDAVDTAPSASP